jgi:hypothetical protein
VVLSNFPWYSTLVFAEATKWLPAHRQIWEFGPYLIALTSIALMSWAALRVAGRWAAALTAVILVCAGPNLLELMFWLTNHTPTWYSLALLAAFLVLVTDRRISVGWLPLVILTLVIGVIAGINLATDKELLISGMLPMMCAGVVTWGLTRTPSASKAMWLALAVTAVTGLSAIATTSIMHSAGILGGTFPLHFASTETLSTNVKSWWQSIAILGNGAFFGEAITFTASLALVCAVLSVGLVFLIPRYTWRYLHDRRPGGDPLNEQLTVYMVFWATSIVFLSVGFILSSVPIYPVTTETTHYLVGIVYGIAAMLPLLARANIVARAAVVAGTIVFLLGASVALSNSNLGGAPSPNVGPSPQVAAEVARAAEAMDATRGYGLYWDAAAITWRANFRVLVAPVVGCSQGPAQLCPGPHDYLEEWYYASPRRTFLLTDTSVIKWSPPATLGPAIATYRFGTVTMYVYGYDIAQKLF